MMRRMMVAAVAAAGMFAGTGAQAVYQTAADFNLFVIGNANMQGSDTEGRVAIGGNAVFDNYTVGQKASSGATNLVVKGDLKIFNGGSTNGGIVVGGAKDIQANYASGGVAPSGTPLPVDFAAEAIRLKNLTATLAGYAQTGMVGKVNYGAHNTQLTLTGASAGLNVFNLSGADFTDTSTFTLNLTGGGNALINVSGASDAFYNAGMTINGGTAGNVLFNFSQATSLNVYSAGIQGSVLAPYASYAPSGSGNVNGQLIVNSFTGTYAASTQVNDYKYAASLLSLDTSQQTPYVLSTGVPEPASWALMLAGFGFVGAAIRRRRCGKPASTLDILQS